MVQYSASRTPADDAQHRQSGVALRTVGHDRGGGRPGGTGVRCRAWDVHLWAGSGGRQFLLRRLRDRRVSGELEAVDLVLGIRRGGLWIGPGEADFNR